MNPNFRNFALWVVIFLLVLALVTLFQSPSQRASTNEIPYSQLINEADRATFKEFVSALWSSGFTECDIVAMCGVRDVPLLAPEAVPGYLYRGIWDNSARALLICLFLLRQQLAAPLGAQRHQCLLLGHGKGPALTCALYLDQLSLLRHHAVQVHLRPAVLAVLQVQQEHILHDARRHTGDIVQQWQPLDHAVGHQLFAGQPSRSRNR